MIALRSYSKGASTLGHANCIEQNGYVTVTLGRIAGTSGAVSVQYRAFVDSGDTATAGADFQSQVGSVFFGDGQSSAVSVYERKISNCIERECRGR